MPTLIVRRMTRIGFGASRYSVTIVTTDAVVISIVRLRSLLWTTRANETKDNTTYYLGDACS